MLVISSVWLLWPQADDTDPTALPTMAASASAPPRTAGDESATVPRATTEAAGSQERASVEAKGRKPASVAPSGSTSAPSPEPTPAKIGSHHVAAYFRASSATVPSASIPWLMQLAPKLQRCPGTLVVAGHTDDQGDEAINQRLSRRRALAVVDVLGELGIDLEKVEVSSRGSDVPLSSNDTWTGRSRNRRVTVTCE